MNALLQFLATLLDSPELQGPAADFFVAIVRVQIGAGPQVQKDVADFCTLIAAKLTAAAVTIPAVSSGVQVGGK